MELSKFLSFSESLNLKSSARLFGPLLSLNSNLEASILLSYDV